MPTSAIGFLIVLLAIMGGVTIVGPTIIDAISPDLTEYQNMDVRK